MEEKFGIVTKKYMLDELKEKFGASSDFVITNYKGLSSQAIEKLRKELRKTSSGYFVVKNSTVRRALNELNIKDLEEYIEGEVGIGFTSDIIKASKALVDFAKENKALKLGGAYIDGKPQPADKIKQLAALPPREVLYAMVLSYMKSPITGFVGILNNLLKNFIYAISEIKKKKEGGEAK